MPSRTGSTSKMGTRYDPAIVSVPPPCLRLRCAIVFGVQPNVSSHDRVRKGKEAERGKRAAGGAGAKGTQQRCPPPLRRRTKGHYLQVLRAKSAKTKQTHSLTPPSHTHTRAHRNIRMGTRIGTRTERWQRGTCRGTGADTLINELMR